MKPLKNSFPVCIHERGTWAVILSYICAFVNLESVSGDFTILYHEQSNNNKSFYCIPGHNFSIDIFGVVCI